MTLHPNVVNVGSVWMGWVGPQSLSRNQYSDTGFHTSGKIYTCNITISPLLIRHSGRYVCAVTVNGRNVQLGDINITVMSKLSI